MPIGVGHWWIILLVLLIVLIVYGPGKLPDVGSAIGKGVREFRKAFSDLREDVEGGYSVKGPEPGGEPPRLPAADKEGVELPAEHQAKGPSGESR